MCAIEMREKCRLRRDVGGAAGAVVREPEDGAFSCRGDDKIDVVEAAIEHPAVDRRGGRIALDQELRRVLAGRRIDRVEIKQQFLRKAAWIEGSPDYEG
jgi:hypothetical protein